MIEALPGWSSEFGIAGRIAAARAPALDPVKQFAVVR